jgi:hypothetical protein
VLDGGWEPEAFVVFLEVALAGEFFAVGHRGVAGGGGAGEVVAIDVRAEMSRSSAPPQRGQVVGDGAFMAWRAS